MTHRFEKHGVVHVFHDMDTDCGRWFFANFQTWEEDTFHVFEKVRDPGGVAIDIGAWIGTTSIWLSHNFSRVIAIESDPVSQDFLRRNLAASGCDNVTVCERPISDVEKDVVFGPRKNTLNESMSYIKEHTDNPHDVTLRTVTFRNLPIPDGANITFVKCDIEGGEETIINDLLTFCLQHNAQAWLSFHISWWKDQNLQRFGHLFSQFNTDVADPVDFLTNVNAFGSILFTPKSQ